MSDHVTVVLTRNEASAALDALLELGNWSGAEMRDRLGWNRSDVAAWRSAAYRLDQALSIGTAA